MLGRMEGILSLGLAKTDLACLKICKFLGFAEKAETRACPSLTGHLRLPLLMNPWVPL